MTALRPVLPLLACAALGLLAGPARAGRHESDVLLQQALRLQTNPPPGVSREEALDRAFLDMAKAFEADPSNWNVLLQRGLNRCLKADLNRDMLVDALELMRTQGRTPQDVDLVRARGTDFIDNVVVAAYREFSLMLRVMNQTRTKDRDAIEYANAMMKFAKAEYLKAQNDQPGAIDDLKSLIKRGWQAPHCAELLARIYMRLGADAFREEDYTKAQEYWDKGLGFAVSDALKRDLLTNKAAAHATRNEYTLAEGVLRDLLRREPEQPAHWKNLGLVLGYQNLLDPALFAYRRARELSRSLGRGDEIALRHGNAWLKAAMIHGKLKESDGDLSIAWRLFIEYRTMFGDDYNFCFNFGEFCFHMERYDLAWTFLRRAAEIHPFCPNPWLLLVRVAQRLTDGTPEEQKERRETVKRELDAARAQYAPSQESHAVKRICGGLQEPSEEKLLAGPVALLDPDPLDGATALAPPEWILAKAKEREPYEAYSPTVAEFLGIEGEASNGSEGGEAPAGKPEAASGGREPVLVYWIAGAAVILLLVGVAAVRRRRAA